MQSSQLLNKLQAFSLSSGYREREGGRERGREKEGEREGERERGREKEGEREGEGERGRERERERERGGEREGKTTSALYSSARRACLCLRTVCTLGDYC